MYCTGTWTILGLQLRHSEHLLVVSADKAFLVPTLQSISKHAAPGLAAACHGSLGLLAPINEYCPALPKGTTRP